MHQIDMLQIFVPSGNLSVWYKIAFPEKLKLIQCHGSQTTGLTVKNDIFGVIIQQSKGQGDSSVLHCASLLRAIFASLACANERVYIHK